VRVGTSPPTSSILLTPPCFLLPRDIFFINLGI
jgi:hypothetical protein